MKRLLSFALLLICFSCLKEEDADPGKATTFVRYFNGGFDDLAQAFEETSDNGFTILANTQITDANVTVQRSKIKLIKTDQYGNAVWQSLYPAFADAAIDTFYYRGRDFLVETDGNGDVTGYTIVGDSIDHKTGIPYFFLIQTDENGVFNELRTKSFPSIPNVRGQAITKDSNGDYIVLGLRNGADNDMILAKLDQTTLVVEWVRTYGGGSAISITGLMTDAQDNIYWSGTVKRDFAKNEMRFAKAKPDNASTEFDYAYGEPDANEEASGLGFSTFGSSYLLVGTTDELGSKDILYRQVSAAGDSLFSSILGDSTKVEEGNAITATAEGTIIILGTTGLDEEKDYTLMKINIFGNVIWTRVFGSSREERGISVKQASDGSYVILGASTLGGLGGIMLMKTDKNGNIE